MYREGHNVTSILRFHTLWHDFTGYLWNHSLTGPMKKKVVLYLLVLSGWISFCFWLYTNSVYDRLHKPDVPEWAEFSDSLEYPVAFRWQSLQPIIGPRFDAYVDRLLSADSAGHIVLITGQYFRDEVSSDSAGLILAEARIESIYNHLGISERNTLKNTQVKEVDADVRTGLFEAVQTEIIDPQSLWRVYGDTAELCFLLSDKMEQPASVRDKVMNWLQVHVPSGAQFHITGIADGTGIAESADMAMERALYVRDLLSELPARSDSVIISTGQRNLPRSLFNRCVIMYNE